MASGREPAGRRDGDLLGGPLFQTLFEHNPEGVLLAVTDGTILRANPAACAMLGRTEEEIRAAGRRGLVVDDPQLHRLVAERERVGAARGELEFRRANGSTFVGEVTTIVVPSDEQQPRSYVIFRDLGPQREREQALRRSEQRYRDLVRLAPDAIFVNRGGRIELANPAALVLYGASSPDQILGRSPFEFLHPEDQALVRERVRQLDEGRPVARVEERIVRLDGQVRDVEVTAAPFVDDRGHAIQVMLRDVTDRRRAMAALRESEARLTAVVESLAEGLVLCELDGHITFCNRAALELFGYGRLEDVQQHLSRFADVFELSGPDGAVLPLARWPLARVVAGERLASEEVRVRHLATGWRRVVRIGGGHLHDSRGRPRMALLTVRDVTEERRLQDQALQGRKLESLGRLAGGIAHDFNNLLTVVLSCAAALREQVAGGAAAEDLEEIAAAGERGRDLTRQLLAFARRQVVQPVPLDLNALLRASERLLRRVLGEDIALAVTLQPGLWRTRCDPGQLEQVVVNLALNARDAMPAGGTLAIVTSQLAVAPGAAAGAGAPEGEWVVLAVRDDGVGMIPEVRERIFEPFFTTKDPGRGTGLGLATVYGIVQQAGGWIHVESDPGRGTVFRIGLPRTLDEPAPATAARAGAAAPSAGGETALVVEDDPHVRGVTVRTLRGAGYRVLEAGDAAAALEALGREPGFVHLLVTDVVLPGLGGRQLADEVARRRPGIRVLFVSGHVRDPQDEERLTSEGAAFLPKPFTPDGLLAAARAALQRA